MNPSPSPSPSPASSPSTTSSSPSSSSSASKNAPLSHNYHTTSNPRNLAIPGNSVCNSHHQQCNVTQAVRMLTTYRTTLQHYHTQFTKYFYSPAHFPKILTSLMMGGGLAGYSAMELYTNKKLEERTLIYVEAYHSDGRDVGDKRNIYEHSNISSVESRSDVSFSFPLSATTLARKITNRVASQISEYYSSSQSPDEFPITSSGLQRTMTKFW